MCKAGWSWWYYYYHAIRNFVYKQHKFLVSTYIFVSRVLLDTYAGFRLACRAARRYIAWSPLAELSNGHAALA